MLSVWVAFSIRVVLRRLEGGVDRAALVVGLWRAGTAGLEVKGESESWRIDLRSLVRGEERCWLGDCAARSVPSTAAWTS